MKRLTILPARVALLAALVAACTGDVPSAAVPADPALARGGPSAAAAYTLLDVGALLPGSYSEAYGVNNSGDVVGFYDDGTAFRAFALVAGIPITLGGGPGLAWGMSNGTPAFIAGSSGGLPARWSLANPAQPTLLPLTGSETNGRADAVNDAGDAVGAVGQNAAMWLADGTRIPITTPAPWVRGEGRGIDNDGLAIFQFFGPPAEYPPARAYLRLASGALVELPPVGGDVTSYVNDIGEVANGAVYVAGSTLSSSHVSRSVRWTVNVTTGAITATDVLSTTGAHGLAVSDAGGIAGFIQNKSLRSEAYLWRGTNVLKLGAPKGSSGGEAWTISRSGQYVAGRAIGHGAVRWTIATP